MSTVIVIIVGVVEAVALIFVLLKVIGVSESSGKRLDEEFAGRRSQYDEVKSKVNASLAELRPFEELAKLIAAAKIATDSLKADRGRVTITQAELETVETRLRELEEIERELEASNIETEEEVKILSKKEGDLTAKNAALKEQIRASSERIHALLDELKDNAVLQEQVQNMKTNLILCEQKAEEMVMQIELGNEQYFELKRRYDALDIEYAQLYEKFSEAEAILNKGKAKEA